ncbi:FtsQ-type POTRA domain-containing protein [Frondihabitans sp. Leaf304]|uniref:FtsQ-type POTRA domain-containing protein n=1 Tax=Frondihabitans sp. Leaf304 TaxID=1736329 RepID=UPI00138F255D|nr:FtsQ-type POTRA domain-containing protein [Frondihabitans sp. Leaf304]
MKRPEGFDRTPVAKAKATPEPEIDAASAEASVASATAPGDEAAPAAEKSTRSLPRLPALPSLPVRPSRPSRESGAEPSDPAVITPASTGARDARDRARDARRLARRAAAARRAVERVEVRRFTRRSRHRRAALITAAAVVVALVGSVAIAVFSPLLSLQTITIEGTSRVDEKAVLKSLDSQIGKPLALIDFAAVKSDLSEFPLIESYVTETMPPHTLVIRITERSPIASVKIGKTFELVDPAGVVISSATKRPAGVPVVKVAGDALDGKVYRSTAEVLLALPSQLLKRVNSVSASTADDVTLKLTTGETVVWGSADQSTKKALLLTGLIKDHTARDPEQAVEYDVSAPDNGIIRTK